MTALGHRAPEEDIATFVDEVRRVPARRGELLPLLPENSPLYAGRTAAEVTRLRGYLLAAFADTGLPGEALPYLIEALESGHLAYEVAGAAIGVRGLATPPAELADALLHAVQNLRGSDSTVSFERYDPRWPYRRPTTALTEVLRTIRHFAADTAPILPQLEVLAGQRGRFSHSVQEELLATVEALRDGGDDCCGQKAPTAPFDGVTYEGPLSAALEDQDGLPERFETFYRGKPSVVAFFYTRCDNPYRCSLTITKLAALQAAVQARHLDGRVKLTAITYDPEYELPHRLRQYGHDRGVRFGDDVRFFRVTSGFEQLRRHFGLGVNYGASTVNLHRIELHVLDPHGAVAASFTRRQWAVEDLVTAVDRVLGG